MIKSCVSPFKLQFQFPASTRSMCFHSQVHVSEVSVDVRGEQTNEQIMMFRWGEIWRNQSFVSTFQDLKDLKVQFQTFKKPNWTMGSICMFIEVCPEEGWGGGGRFSVKYKVCSCPVFSNCISFWVFTWGLTNCKLVLLYVHLCSIIGVKCQQCVL